jgi:hypothetical protein
MRTVTLAATIWGEPEPAEDQDVIVDQWAEAVEAASDRFKAEHPGWFVC